MKRHISEHGLQKVHLVGYMLCSLSSVYRRGDGFKVGSDQLSEEGKVAVNELINGGEVISLFL